MLIRHFTAGELLILVQAMQWTILLSAIAFVGGGLVGLPVAILRVSTRPWVRRVVDGYIRLLQGTPLLMQLFIVYYGLGVLGFRLEAIVAAGFALTLYTSAFLGEIWRGCIEAVPKTQWEASNALGLTRLQQFWYVILPQAAKISIPPTVGFLVQVVKNTSLASIVGFQELSRAGQLVNNAVFQPFTVYACVALLYFALCYPLSALAKGLERKMNVGR